MRNFGDPDTYYLDPDDGFRDSRNEDAFYWTAYVAGIYEFFPQTTNDDNDPNSELARLGQTQEDEPEYSVVMMEIIRDLAAEHNWNQNQINDVIRLVTLHEVGHQFELGHNGVWLENIMRVHMNAAQEAQIPGIQPVFSEEDLHNIRRHGGTGEDSHP